MISVDTVYQKVLTLLNKEQRGYLTPQEFNLMAGKAQMEIFDGYFHDLKIAFHKMKTDINHADEIEMINEKLQKYKRSINQSQTANTATFSLPANTYYLEAISVASTGAEVIELSQKELLYSQQHPLTKATTSRPIYTRTDNTITLLPIPTEATDYTIDYYRKPYPPKWTYVVVKGRALFNVSDSTQNDFTLHFSEEENLVSRILQLSGVIVQKPGIMEVGTVERADIKTQQNN